jgi:peptidoglycan/LPS O-acetylase OafA/YrhL
MPVFVGISGVLFNIKYINEINVQQLFKKYAFRLLLPWALAVTFYYFFTLYQFSETFSVSSFIRAFVFPYYHLWFIPAFLSWVVFTWGLKKLKVSNDKLLAISAALSLVSTVLLKYPELISPNFSTPDILKALIRSYGPHFYFFFVLGIYLKNKTLDQINLLNYIFIYLYYYPNSSISFINFFLFNGFIINLILKIATKNLVRSNPFMEWLGVHSLAIYLWHVLPIGLCHIVFGTDNLNMFYIIVALLQVSLMISYLYLVKVDFLRKYVFGLP